MPNKYFTLDAIHDAVSRLRTVDRKWLLIPLVFAVNGVTAATSVDLQATGKKGTDKFLRRFFSAELIGLESKKPGAQSSVTPLFADLTADQPEHLAKQTDGNLWGNNFSVGTAGYPKLRDDVILMKTSGSVHQLGPGFTKWFRDNIPSDFRFEDLLVWLYAFSGFPDNISSWQELFDHFVSTEAVGKFPVEYVAVFKLTTPKHPWPTAFLAVRPTDKELQDLLLPGVSPSVISGAEYSALRQVLATLLKNQYLGYSDEVLEKLALSIVSGLQSCRRLFLFGEPGTGKTQLALLISVGFDQVFGDRVHTVSAPIADSTTPDKLVGFSTLDGRWIDGMLTQQNTSTGRKLLYPLTDGALKLREREQINVMLLDEVNRRDAEELLAKLQSALDSESSVPEHVSNQVKLDNSGERYLSPNTFLIMSGNSPRDDSGRVVQSRPFNRRHNLIPIRNAFETALASPPADFAAALVALWEKRGSNFSIEAAKAEDFKAALSAETAPVGALQTTLQAMGGYGIGLSYGLMKKLLQTAGARYAMTIDFRDAIDHALAESVLPLLGSEVVIDGRGVREQLLQVDATIRSVQLKAFFASVQTILSEPDAFGRARQFI